MTEFQKDIFLLLKSAITGTVCEIKNDFDWKLAKEYGRKHKILPLLFIGADNSNVEIPIKVKNDFLMSYMAYLNHSEKQLYELEIIKKRFNERNLKYVILKGSILKHYYPQPELRPMGDIDILIDQEQYNDIRSVMSELDYVEGKESDHELVWQKNDVMIELHKKLIPSYNKDYYVYFEDCWKMVKAIVPNSNIYVFSAEDNFIYIFSHFTKHYRDAGIGILHLVDLYVYKSKHMDMDIEYIESALEKLKMLKFYKNIMATIDMCFYNGTENDISNYIVDVIFNSGSYGTFESQALSTAVKITKNDMCNSRNKLIWNRIFMPYGKMCQRHKILLKLPILLPIFWIYRIISIIFKKETIKKEIYKINLSSEKNISDYYNSLKLVGLDFDFEE